MNEITITTAQLDNELVQTVNARDLHATLGVGRDFSNWVKVQIKRAGLVDGEDYVTYAQKGVGGQFDSIEYHLTVDASKHVAMMSNTERGRKVRRYFIEVEKAFAAQQPQTPTNMTLVSKDLLKRCMYLGPKGRPTVQGKYLAKLQLPTIGQIGVTNEFGLHPHQLEDIEHENLLSLYVRQDLESRRGAEALMLEDQERIEAYQKQKAKIKLQAQITRAQAKLAQLGA